jgi:hypothetical protein
MALGWRLAVVLVSCVLVAEARAIVIGGGGSGATDCLVVFDADVNYPVDNAKRYKCVDGDPCDADGVVNGVCAFDVAVCANSTYDPAACTLDGVQSITVQHALDNGDKKFDPQFQALQNRIDGAIHPPTTTADACALPTRFTIPVIGPLAGNVCKRGKKQVKLVSYSNFMLGVQRKDTDKMAMECDPAPAGCDPTVLYAGTFDRIQKQIFNQSCAKSLCHDSQSHQNNLVLEEGASYGNLVDVVPTNATAAALGWKRVDATGADASMSFLYHKLTGDLPDPGLGVRMPFGSPALDQLFIDIVRLWIEAGAPQTGWVPGTD